MFTLSPLNLFAYAYLFIVGIHILMYVKMINKLLLYVTINFQSVMICIDLDFC